MDIFFYSIVGYSSTVYDFDEHLFAAILTMDESKESDKLRTIDGKITY